jgi:hypothetical protein
MVPSVFRFHRLWRSPALPVKRGAPALSPVGQFRPCGVVEGADVVPLRLVEPVGVDGAGVRPPALTAGGRPPRLLPDGLRRCPTARRVRGSRTRSPQRRGGTVAGRGQWRERDGRTHGAPRGRQWCRPRGGSALGEDSCLDRRLYGVGVIEPASIAIIWPKATLGAALEAWLRTYEAEETTLDGYRGYVRRTIGAGARVGAAGEGLGPGARGVLADLRRCRTAAATASRPLTTAPPDAIDQPLSPPASICRNHR